MKIEKYKKLKNGKYELILDDGQKLQLYEEVILKYNLLITKKIEKFEEINNSNNEYEIYYFALKYLNNRARTKKEVIDYLLKNEYSQELVEKQVNKLEKQGYIDDEIYAKSFLYNKLLITTYGPLKIKQAMLKKGINEIVINNVLTEYTDDIQSEKINKLVLKMIKSNHTKSNNYLKKKIFSDLLSQGFNKYLIQIYLDKHKFESDKSIRQKEYNKLYKKLSKKYEGNELEFIIKQKLYQKGFITED